MESQTRVGNLGLRTGPSAALENSSSPRRLSLDLSPPSAFVAARFGLLRSAIRAAAFSARLAALGVMLMAGIAQAATYYVNGSCSVNGNGTASSCATASGGAGAWKSLSNISAGGAGDVINIRGGTYSTGQQYFNWPNGRNGTSGNPLVVQNYAGEDVVIDGSSDIKGSTWTAMGGGVYKCTSGVCTTTTRFPMAAWYTRQGQSAEEVLYLKMSGACDSTLPAGFMRYGTSGPVCVHLSDGSNPATAQYLKINYYNSAILMNNFNTHDVTFRRNPSGGSFTIQKFVQYIFVMVPQNNTNITIDGLDIGYVMDRCIDLDSSGASTAAGIRVLNNHIHHCGQE